MRRLFYRQVLLSTQPSWRANYSTVYPSTSCRLCEPPRRIELRNRLFIPEFLALFYSRALCQNRTDVNSLQNCRFTTKLRGLRNSGSRSSSPNYIKFGQILLGQNHRFTTKLGRLRGTGPRKSKLILSKLARFYWGKTAVYTLNFSRLLCNL